MLLSMNWISDFVDLSGLDKMELIHRFSLSTAEVENEIFHKGKDIENIVVGEILSVEPHPKSDKLHLLKIDCGEGQAADVVCGAPNVRKGMKTAFAKAGARLGELVIEPRPVAGCVSNGMCCSEKELGISDDNSGILEIQGEIANGTDLKEVFAIEDIVFEVDNKSLTNRPDLWGHYGIAREFATLAGRPLKALETADLSLYDGLPAVDMKIEDPLCQRYSCLQIANIRKNVSPMDMRIRLFYCGMRGINLLADLTNYLMLEMGQPMHAFDSRKVEKIRVRRFDKPFLFRTLDGVDREIDENTLMICNGETPVAIAGIMGGLDSEIVEDTTTLTLESATFDSVSVRKSSVRLSHRTDASARYEKSLDPEMTVTAIARFLKLLRDIDPEVEVVSALTDEYAFRYPEVTLEFDRAYVDRYTGIRIGDETIVETLTALGFGVETERDDPANVRFRVKVPSFRATKDVTIKADIIEEITRIYGYDNFDIHTAMAPLYPVRASAEKCAEEKIKDLLVKKFSLHELHSYVWAYAEEYKKLGIEVEENVRLSNASSPGIETLRRSIVPTQFCQVKSNLGYGAEFGIFEIGRIVDGLDDKGLCRERRKLAITLYSRTKTLEQLYFGLRDMLAAVVGEVCRQEIRFEAKTAAHSYQHPRNLNAVYCCDREIGEIGVAHPAVMRRIDKKGEIVYGEIDMEQLTEIPDRGIVYEEPSKYPQIEVDLSFVADRFEKIGKAIAAVKSELIQKVMVTDTYADESGKSITVRLVFSRKDRTLTREEVMAVADSIVEKLESEGIRLKLS